MNTENKNPDCKCMDELDSLFEAFDANIGQIDSDPQIYPLDKEIREKLIALRKEIPDSTTEYALYQHYDKIQELWIELTKKSIQCLRFFDDREPFKTNNTKHPLAYGVSKLNDYYDKYKKFENVMYGGVKYYRDHVAHVFRVWMLGCVILLRDNCRYLNNIEIAEECNINSYEKISIWTLIALTHDLGYPLETASKIIDTTREMMTAFISNPIVSMDLSFNGVQNSMNDFILRLISSKMIRKSRMNVKHPKYVARLQSKYYFKFQKSLEHNKHGILSAIIIYKLLLYFLESDFTINEDYTFNSKDVKQFYIRRDILRAIASHTCSDVYQLKQDTFSFLLIICDDAQTWGRKGIAELYVNKKSQYYFKGVNVDVKTGTWSVFDSYVVNDVGDAQNVLNSFKRQCKNYVVIFRDGQETEKRDFNFVWDMSLKVKNVTLQVVFTANKNERIQIELRNIPVDEKDLNSVKDVISYFDDIYDYHAQQEPNDNQMHVCDFINAEI